MPTLSDSTIINLFAREAFDLSDPETNLSESQRQQKLEWTISRCAGMAQIPQPDFKWLRSSQHRGLFYASRWAMDLRIDVLSSPENAYHELHHAEQYMRMLRGLLNNKNNQLAMPHSFKRSVEACLKIHKRLDMPLIVEGAMAIPHNVVLYAQTLGPLDESLRARTQEWLNSYYGPSKKHREDVLNELPGISTGPQGIALDAPHRLRNIIAEIGNQNDEYSHLPEERDALVLEKCVLERMVLLQRRPARPRKPDHLRPPRPGPIVLASR